MQPFKKFLNPLHKDIDQILDFSQTPIDSELEKEEYPHLENVVSKKIEEIKKLLPRMEKLEKELDDQIEIVQTEVSEDDRKDAQKLYNQLLKQMKILVERINRELIAVDSPYFGKIQFKAKDSKSNNPLQLYIGKIAILDEHTNLPIVTDWRAPIANLYYQNSGPKDDVCFEAPVGTRMGDLLQKRQFQISRARIHGIYDAKSGNAAADEFLLSQLNERLGKKLQDIVSTIQSQQNSIIREEIDKPVLIQGVAGSGKTTIILHRLAYLFYTYKEKIRANNSLIVAPNQMFIDYVSDVLPNLGVESVETVTYLFWAKKLLGWDDNYVSSKEPENIEFKKYKGSREFLDLIDSYFVEFEDTLLENIPYSRKELIINRYYALKKSFADIDMEERLKLSVDYAFAQKQFREKQAGSYMQTHDLDKEKKQEILKYFKKNCDSLTLYKNLYKSKNVPKEISKYTLKGLGKEKKYQYYRMEDLAPITYLHQKIHSLKEHTKDYVMIDEAQDLSLIQIATLANISKNGNITLAGDLAQSIIPPFYIKDWEDVFEVIKKQTNQETSYHQLQKCYRTTVEIIEFANKLFKDHFPKSYKLPEAVLRHGEDVKITEIQGDIVINIDVLASIINKEFEKEIATCAIICRNRQHSQEVFDALNLKSDNLTRGLVNYLESDYKDGIIVLPIDQAKGLEFDSVIIPDLNSNYYPQDELSYRLLYVGLTRALHKLHILKEPLSNGII